MRSAQEDRSAARRLGRYYMHGALVIAVMMTSGFVATRASGAPAHPAQLPVVPPTLQSGQTVTHGLLSREASQFPTPAKTWSPLTSSPVAWTITGHKSRGAMVLTGPTNAPRAASPAFDVHPGMRYRVTAWMQARSRTTAALGLEFLNARGQVIPGSQLVGQGNAVRRLWTQTMPVLGFAPTTAVTGKVVVLGLDKTAKSTRTLVDSVDVSQISGVAHRIDGPLTTQGRNIIDANGTRVVLRGAELEGLFSLHQLPMTTMLQEIAAAQTWGANFIRLPLDPDQLLSGSCSYDSAYLRKIDEVVAAITARGMVVEIDLHGFSLFPCGEPHLVNMPEPSAVTFWQQIASRYKSNSLVAFEVYNEPHDISQGVWRNGGAVTYGGVHYTAVGLVKLYRTIRATGATNLVVIPGNKWATLPAAPLANATNVAYAAHVYTCPTGLGDCLPKQYGPHGQLDPSKVTAGFARLGQTHPILMDEFGYPNRREGRFDAAAIAAAERLGWAGWAAFTFDGTTVGMFDIVANIGAIENPSPRGMAVMNRLIAN